MLKITTAYGYLKVSPDIEIPITITNPMFNDRGSYSLPFTVPLKPNRAALGFPDSLHSKSAKGEFVDCSIELGMFKEKGTLKITDITESEVELTLTTREGAFWEWAKNKKLTELNFPTSDPYNGTSGEKMNAWKQRITESHDKTWPQEVFNAFPVVVKIEMDPEQEVLEGTGIFRMELLNKMNPDDGNLAFENMGTYWYNISPFLYLNFIIRLISETYGYKLVNELETIIEFNRACIINNCAMSIVNGVISWPDLVPNISINDFIKNLENKIGCCFFIDSLNKKIHLKLIKNIINKESTVRINGKLKLLKSEPIQIKLTSDKASGSYSEVVKYDDDYLSSIPNVQYSEYYPIPDGLFESEGSTPDLYKKMMYVKAMESYFFTKSEYVESDQYPYKQFWNFIGNRNRNYEPANDLSEKKFDSNFVTIPMVWAFINHAFVPGVKSTPVFVLPFFDYELKTLKTNEFGILTYDNSPDFPLNICIYRGKHLNNTFTGHNFYYPWGSSFTYIRTKEPLNNLPVEQDKLYPDTLTMLYKGTAPDSIGIYDFFWMEIEQYFLKSAKKVEIKNVKAIDLLKNKLWNVFNIDNNNIIIDEVNVSLKLNTIEFDSATGFTLKPYT